MGRFSPRLALPSALKREILHNESDKNVVKRDKSFKREADGNCCASAPGLAVEESYVRLLNHLPGLAYRCRVGRADPIVSERLEYTLEFVSKGSYDISLGIPAEDMVQEQQQYHRAHDASRRSPEDAPEHV